MGNYEGPIYFDENYRMDSQEWSTDSGPHATSDIQLDRDKEATRERSRGRVLFVKGCGNSRAERFALILEELGAGKFHHPFTKLRNLLGDWFGLSEESFLLPDLANTIFEIPLVFTAAHAELAFDRIVKTTAWWDLVGRRFVSPAHLEFLIRCTLRSQQESYFSECWQEGVSDNMITTHATAWLDKMITDSHQVDSVLLTSNMDNWGPATYVVYDGPSDSEELLYIKAAEIVRMYKGSSPTESMEEQQSAN